MGLIFTSSLVVGQMVVKRFKTLKGESHEVMTDVHLIGLIKPRLLEHAFTFQIPNKIVQCDCLWVIHLTSPVKPRPFVHISNF